MTLKIQTALKKIIQAQSEEDLKVQAILAHVEALSMFYQSAHWLTSGPTYYADHLLLERLYNETSDEIDSLGERSVGKFDPSGVLVETRLANITSVLESVQVEGSFLARALALENSLIALLDEIEKAEISSGTRDLFAGIADAHEVHTYLINQRLKEI
jgi:DNA-binding ferritin-like protein